MKMYCFINGLLCVSACVLYHKKKNKGLKVNMTCNSQPQYACKIDILQIEKEKSSRKKAAPEFTR